MAKLEQEGDTRYVQKAALEALGRLQEPVLQKAIRLYPQNAEAHYNLGVSLICRTVILTRSTSQLRM